MGELAFPLMHAWTERGGSGSSSTMTTNMMCKRGDIHTTYDGHTHIISYHDASQESSSLSLVLNPKKFHHDEVCTPAPSPQNAPIDLRRKLHQNMSFKMYSKSII
jgi:hypothetical protein